jgi:hypothetical protein
MSSRRNRDIAIRTFYLLQPYHQSAPLLQCIVLGLSYTVICTNFSFPVDEREAEPRGDLSELQPSVDLAIAETSETKPEVTLVPKQGSPEPLISTLNTNLRHPRIYQSLRQRSWIPFLSLNNQIHEPTFRVTTSPLRGRSVHMQL